MSDNRQSKGREANGAIPGGNPDPADSDAEVRKVGRQSTRAAGPDGPDATEVGDTFKKKPA